jgi:hypothetical protein
VAAPDVGDHGALAKPVRDAHRGQPLLDEVSVVAGAEEPLAAVVHVAVVLVPPDTGAAAGGVRDPAGTGDGADGDLEQPGQERRARLVGEGDGMLGRERVAGRRGVVVHDRAGRLRIEPLAGVVRVGAGGHRELGRRERTSVGQGPVVAELVAHHDEGGVEGGADLVDGPEDERHEPVAVDGPPGLLFSRAGHGAAPSVCRWPRGTAGP